jgi:hypothetical protein
MWLLVAVLVLGCGSLINVVPVGDRPPTEINEGDNPPPPESAQNPEIPPTATPLPTATPTPAPTPTPTPTRFFLQSVSLTPQNGCAGPDCPPRDPPRHGLLIAFVLPVLVLGIPWIILEYGVVRYIQPRSLDLSGIRVKTQDGLFVDAVVSVTARRNLNLASTRMTWGRVSDFVEKPVEQELLHQAIQYPTLEDLEKNLKNTAESFMELPVVRELKEDFGVEVMRFNIEARYPQETMDALNRRAEAAAGGTAYLAYAAAAHLNPDSPEARELYRVFQETQGQVDAARNLGGGLTSIAGVLGQRRVSEVKVDDDADFE